MKKSEYVDLIKSTALDVGKRAVMKYLIAKFPFFSLGFINPVTAMVVGCVLDIAIKETEMGAFFSYIDLRTSIQGKTFENAAYKYKIANEGRDDAEKKLAEQELLNSFNNLIKFTS